MDQQFYVRVNTIPSGRFACHSCMRDLDEKHIQFWDWERRLCFPCADALWRRMKEIVNLAGDVKQEQLFEKRP